MKFVLALKQIIKKTRLAARIKYKKERKATAPLPIAYRNWWSSEPSHLTNDWFYAFITKRLNITADHPILSIFSVFGRKDTINLVKQEQIPIVFYTGENLYSGAILDWTEYQDHCLEDVDLALGFSVVDNKKYLRFPIWLCYDFPADANYTTIVKLVNEAQNKRLQEKVLFCSLVASHDLNGLRTKLFNSLSPIGQIDAGGRLLKNTFALQEKFNNNKLAFLENYMFNICPENSNKEYYVTEKIFDAISAGTLPIYWGSNNNPEPDLLNKEAILFYSEHEPIENLYNKVAELYSDKRRYKEFMSQPIYKPYAAEYIFDKLNDLEYRLKVIIKNT